MIELGYYLSIGLIVSLCVTYLSEAPFATKTFTAIGFLTFGWPIAILFIVNKAIKKLSG